MALLETDPVPDTDNQDQPPKPPDSKSQAEKPAAIPSWLQSVEDKNLQENETLRRFHTPQALAVSYVELRNKLGANPVAIPEEKAPPEKWDEFYNRLGRPEKPEKYELTAIDGLDRSPEAEKNFRLKAHQIGLTQRQADELNKWVGELHIEKTQADLQAHNKTVEEAESILKKEWGNDYAKNLVIANKALHRFGGKDLAKVLQSKGLDGDPAMVRFFMTIGKTTMEESDLKGMGTGHQPGLKSRAQLEEMMKDKRYWTDSEYRKIVENGFAALYGGQTAQ